MGVKCIFCGSINTYKSEDILSPLNGKQYTLHHCNSCQIRFILPNVYEDVYTDGVSNFEDSCNDLSVRLNESLNDYVRELHSGRTVLEPPTLEVIKYLKRFKVDLSDKKILDIGAGDGINFLGLNEHFNIDPDNYHIIESDSKSVDICRQRGINHIYTDYFGLDTIDLFPSGFDLVIFTEVLEHQTDPAGFIEAVKRVTKPDGLIIFTVPNREMLKVSRSVFYADFPPHHFLRLNKAFFLKNFSDFRKLKISVYPNPFMIINRERACRKVSRAIFKTEKLWSLIHPLFSVLYKVWSSILLIKGNGIIVVLRRSV